MLTKKFMRHRISPLGTPLAEANWRLITSLLLDKGKPFARLGRKATGQVIPDSRVTEGRIPQFSVLQKLPIRLLAVEKTGSQKQGGTSVQIYAMQINVDRWSSYELSPIRLGAEFSSRSG
jgi:hypothetical protein